MWRPTGTDHSHQVQARGRAQRAKATEAPSSPAVFQLFEEEPGGGWQSRVQRHTVEQIVDVALVVQILDAPVPQVVDQLMDLFKASDTAIPEQVKCPSFCKTPPQRTVLSEPQTAEQLVEVPTVVGLSRRLSCRSSTLQLLALVVLLVVEVFKVSSQKRVLLLLSSGSLTP